MIELNTEKITEQCLQIFPKLTKRKVELFCSIFDMEIPKSDNFEEFPEKLIHKIYQIYVSKTISTKNAILCRFLQHLDYAEMFESYELIEKFLKNEDFKIDLIIENKFSKKTSWIYTIDFLDLRTFEQIKNQIKKNASNKDKIEEIDKLEEIVIVAAQIDRRMALEVPNIKIDGKIIGISYIVEFIDPNRPFKDEDMLICEEIELGAFNFGTLDDVIEAIKSLKGKGRYEIFLSNADGENSCIWKGFIFPKKLIKRG